MVPATDAITLSATCAFVKPRSARTSGISGARPNQPKKQRKNAIHVMWKARMGGVLKLNRRILVAFIGYTTAVVKVENHWAAGPRLAAAEAASLGGRGRVFVEITASLDGHQ